MLTFYVIPRNNRSCCDVGISRKRHCRKGAFRQIATANENHVFLAILAKTALVFPKAGEGIYARAFAARTAARLRTYLDVLQVGISKHTICCHDKST